MVGGSKSKPHSGDLAKISHGAHRLPLDGCVGMLAVETKLGIVQIRIRRKT